MNLFRQYGCCALFLLGTTSVLGQDYVPGEIIVRLKSVGGSQLSSAFLSKAHSQKEMSLKHSWGKLNMYHFQMNKAAGQKSMEQRLEELRQDPDVLYAEPNYIIKKATNFEAEHVYDQEEIMSLAQQDLRFLYGPQIDFTQVHEFISSHSFDYRPIVAILDSGLDTSHSLFMDSDALWVNENEIPSNGIDDDGNGYIDDVHGFNFAYRTGNIDDDDGHGTHVAGIILKFGLDLTADPMGQSVIRLMPLKFLDSEGRGTISTAIEAIYYALNNGATVFNNSWGGEIYSAALHDAVVATYRSGAVFVAAAGNSSSNNDSLPTYPATYTVPHVLSIAATTDQDVLAYFSNYGANSVHVGSPGFNVLSTYLYGSWATLSGTSMAAPFVSGIAALMKAISPNMFGYQIKNLINLNVDSVIHLEDKVTTKGRVNVYSAISAADEALVDPFQPDYNPSYLSNISRELASELSGGGCGLVTKLYRDFNRGQGLGGSGRKEPGAWFFLVIFALFALPLALTSWFRFRDLASRRRHSRYEIQTVVTLDLGGKKFKGEVSSISLGGLCVDTDAWPDQEEGAVSMTISSPDGKEKVQAEGKVVWSEEKGTYGIAFDQGKTGLFALSAISAWTKGLRKSS